MQAIIFVTLIILGSFLSNYFFLIVIYEDKGIRLFHPNHNKQRFLYLLLPFSSFFLSKISTEKHKQIKKLRNLNILIELLGILTFTIFGISVFKNNSLLFFVYYLVLVSSLFFLSVHDLLTLSIPEDFTKKLLIFVLGFNIFLAGIRVLGSLLGFSTDFIKDVHLGYIDNLVSGLVIWAAMWLIIKLTKDKGLGEGDVDIMQIIAFSLGFPGILTSFFMTLMVGSVISVLYAASIRKFHGVIVPFVPFILVGFVLVVTFSSEILSVLRLDFFF